MILTLDWSGGQIPRAKPLSSARGSSGFGLMSIPSIFGTNLTRFLGVSAYCLRNSFGIVTSPLSRISTSYSAKYPRSPKSMRVFGILSLSSETGEVVTHIKQRATNRRALPRRVLRVQVGRPAKRIFFQSILVPSPLSSFGSDRH